MRLSLVTDNLKPSATLALNELIAEKKRKGEQICHMGFGQSPFPVHPHISKALCDHAGERSYLPTQGIKPLRNQVSEFYSKVFGLDYSSEQIVIGPGSKILLFDAMMCLEGPLFLPSPSWVSYDQEAHLLGKEVHYIETQPEDSYLLTPEALESTVEQRAPISEQQKLLLLNYPCNPTGCSYSVTQLEELADVARNHNIQILSDEIYALLSFRDHDHHSIAEFYPEGTILTGGLSKDRSAGGFRVGVMLLPNQEQALLDAILAVASNTWTCVAAPIQYAALEAYRPTNEITQYIKDCTSIHELVTIYLHQELTSYGIQCPRPQGAFFLFLDWNNDRDALKRKGITTSVDLANTLLQKWNVACLPGADFGMQADEICIRVTTVDYDGAGALERYRADKEETWLKPDEFVREIAPRLVNACRQLGSFADSIR
ncbi:MAG: pyridoxal phosphate-dependent aminotransferase [Candidatus Thorarchaeota archaeon]